VKIGEQKNKRRERKGNIKVKKKEGKRKKERKEGEVGIR